MSVEFKNAQGLPANQEAKTRAKAASKAAKNKIEYKYLYTEQDGKVLKITAKHNGAYTVFLAKKPKAGKETSAVKINEYNVFIKELKATGNWVDSSSIDEKISELIESAPVPK